MLTHVIAPAPSAEWFIFEKNVSKKNADETPSEGSIAIHFGINTDMRTLTSGDFLANLTKACNEETTPAKLKQPKNMYELLHPGLIIALKKGKSLFAWAEITSPYYYCSKSGFMTPTYKEWGHRWNYKILRMANDLESEKHGGWMCTFHKNAIEIPADVLKIQSLNKLHQSILEHNQKKALLYMAMQDAIASFQTAENELNSLERSLELSEVM